MRRGGKVGWRRARVGDDADWGGEWDWICEEDICCYVVGWIWHCCIAEMIACVYNEKAWS